MAHPQETREKLRRSYIFGQMSLEIASAQAGVAFATARRWKKEAQDALDRFKMEVASEIGVNLKDGYNGDLTSAEAGSVGGNMVKEMISRQEEQMSGK